MKIALRSIRHSEFAVTSEIISLSDLDELNAQDPGLFFFYGLYEDENGRIYQLFVNDRTHRWYAVNQ